jgi:hypothetical protein
MVESVSPMPDEPTHRLESASDPQLEQNQIPEPPNKPHPLEYNRIGAPTRVGRTGEVMLGIGGGCGYAVLALLVSTGVIVANKGEPGTLLLIPAILIGLPAVIALCFRGWRAFALGILIVCGVVLLVFGICALSWKGL